MKLFVKMFAFFMVLTLLGCTGNDTCMKNDETAENEKIDAISNETEEIAQNFEIKETASEETIEIIDTSTDAENTETSDTQGENNYEEFINKINKSWKYGKIVKTYQDSFLAIADTDFGKLHIVVVKGDHYEMGFKYGYLLGDRVILAIETLLDNALGIGDELPPELSSLPPEVLKKQLKKILLDLWDNHFAKYVPEEFKEEMQGIEDGAKKAGVFVENFSVKDILKIGIVISNISDLTEFGEGFDDVLSVFNNGYSKDFSEYTKSEQDNDSAMNRNALKNFHPHGFTCSFFAVWGDNTEDGKMFSSRNLDWASDTGLDGFKQITIYIPKGKNAYLTVGFQGFMGALSGLNEKGVSVSEVGSSSVLERLKGEPWVLKFREILENSNNLDEALNYMKNQVQDDFSRPPTIGYNFMIAFGDPEGNGEASRAAIIETNGIFSHFFVHNHDCSNTSFVYEFDKIGDVKKVTNHDDDPMLANLEPETVEIDKNGNIKKFKVDENGDFVKDENGNYIPDENGKPLPVAKTLPCAFYRGDEAMGYSVRRWQKAANGPQNDNNGLLVKSSSYNGRYLPMYNTIKAFKEGIEYKKGDKVIVPDNGGTQTKIGIDEAVTIARVAAMSSNVFSVVYANTDVAIKFAYENRVKDEWKKASEHEYYYISLKEILDIINSASKQE